MSISAEELDQFRKFAEAKINEDGADSMVELAGEWEATRREMQEATADIRASHDDIDAGRVRPAAEVFADVRSQLDLGE